MEFFYGTNPPTTVAITSRSVVTTRNQPLPIVSTTLSPFAKPYVPKFATRPVPPAFVSPHFAPTTTERSSPVAVIRAFGDFSSAQVTDVFQRSTTAAVFVAPTPSPITNGFSFGAFRPVSVSDPFLSPEPAYSFDNRAPHALVQPAQVAHTSIPTPARSQVYPQFAVHPIPSIQVNPNTPVAPIISLSQDPLPQSIIFATVKPKPHNNLLDAMPELLFDEFIDAEVTDSAQTAVSTAHSLITWRLALDAAAESLLNDAIIVAATDAIAHRLALLRLGWDRWRFAVARTAARAAESQLAKRRRIDNIRRAKTASPMRQPVRHIEMVDARLAQLADDMAASRAKWLTPIDYSSLPARQRVKVVVGGGLEVKGSIAWFAATWLEAKLRQQSGAEIIADVSYDYDRLNVRVLVRKDTVRPGAVLPRMV